MLALTLVFKPLPTASPSIEVCFLLRVIITVPCSMDERIYSASTPSVRAAESISAVIWPLRAASSCVIMAPYL